jgi:hypothetical protein
MPRGIIIIIIIIHYHKGLRCWGFLLTTPNSLGTPLRAHYSSRAFNYRVVLLLRDWVVAGGFQAPIYHISSLRVLPPFMSSLPSCPPSLCVLPPFLFFLPLCSSSLCVLPPFLSFLPSCPLMGQSLSFSTYLVISSLFVGAVHSASPPLPSRLILLVKSNIFVIVVIVVVVCRRIVVF